MECKRKQYNFDIYCIPICTFFTHNEFTFILLGKKFSELYKQIGRTCAITKKKKGQHIYACFIVQLVSMLALRIVNRCCSHAGNDSLKPSTLIDCRCLRTIGRHRMQHFQNELFHFAGKNLFLGKFDRVRRLLSQHPARVTIIEGHQSGDHDEEDNPGAPYISSIASVSLSGKHFRSYIGTASTECLRVLVLNYFCYMIL